MLGEGARQRLKSQLDAIPVFLAGATPEAINARPDSGKWSARENLAHIARHHSLFRERIRRILNEETPQLPRYRAEEDPAWPEWSALPLEEILVRLRSLRAEIVGLIEGLSEERINRPGIHPLLGEMPLPRWVEFFLLHEAHHLYTAMLRIGEAGHRSPKR